MLRSASPSALLALVFVVSSFGPVGAQTATFVQNLDGPAGARFGQAVAVDGATAIIGASTENGSGGAAYVVVRSGSSWVLQQRLQAGDATASGISFGTAVAISGDTAIVGATFARTGGVAGGAAYVFVRSGGVWTQQAKLTAPTVTADAFFGYAVDIDGNTAVVSALQEAIGNQRYGAVYVFDRSGVTWTRSNIAPPTPRSDLDHFGSGVGVSGSTICIGAQAWDTPGSAGQGTALVYVRSGSSWAQQQRLLGTGAAAADAFGADCDIDGDTITVTAPNHGGSGAIYVFTRSGSTWTEQQRVLGEVSGGRPGPVSLRGDIFVVGTPSEGAGSVTGAAYIYRRSGPSWALVQRLGNDGEPNGRLYGTGVGTDATTVMAGAPLQSAPAGTPGNRVTVYAFGATPGGVPGAPTGLAATVAGSVVSLTWAAPASGAAPTGYTLIARTPGGAVLVTQPLGNTTSFQTGAPNGTYVVSIRASNAAGTGPESAAVTVVLPAAVTPPGAPSGLTGSVSGNTAVFTWNPPASGGAVTNYLLVAGTSPGFAVPIASLTLPGTPGASIPGVPPGTFYVRIFALNNGGSSPASNEVSVTVAGPTPPGAPTLNPAVVSGNSVSLSWTPGSGSPTSYTLRAFTASGVLLVTVPGLGGTTAGFSSVPSGSYELELLAVNGAGSSAPSARITVTVP